MYVMNNQNLIPNCLALSYKLFFLIVSSYFCFFNFLLVSLFVRNYPFNIDSFFTLSDELEDFSSCSVVFSVRYQLFAFFMSLFIVTQVCLNNFIVFFSLVTVGFVVVIVLLLGNWEYAYKSSNKNTHNNMNLFILDF